MHQGNRTIQVPVSRFQRQEEIFDPEEYQESIGIIGAGNIGSTTAYGLVKLGMKSIIVYDFDKVEEHNLASQFYGVEDIGKLKTDCLKEHIKKFTGVEIVTDGKFTNQRTYGILIIAVDTMKERERIYKVINEFRPRVIIDGRMGGDTIEIYTANTPAEYKETLVKEVEHVGCSERYISYTSLLIAGLITNQVKRFLKEEEIKPSIALDVSTLRFC